jgi:hypothetical protein
VLQLWKEIDDRDSIMSGETSSSSDNDKDSDAEDDDDDDDSVSSEQSADCLESFAASTAEKMDREIGRTGRRCRSYRWTERGWYSRMYFELHVIASLRR